MPRTKSLGRAVGLMQAVAARPSGSSASELARVTGLPRSTVTRTLRTLADAGLVEHSGGWVLGYELVRLARAADPYRAVVEIARGPLARLRDATGESALLAVFRGRPGVEVVLQVDPERQVGVADWVGVDVPLHASAAGKLALAELTPTELDAWMAEHPLTQFTRSTLTDPQVLRRRLRRVHARGWADLVDELEDGHAALAVAVRGAHGLLGAVGISGPTFRLGRARRQALLPQLQAAAAELASRHREHPEVVERAAEQVVA